MDRDLDMIHDANADIFDWEMIIPRRYIRDSENPMELYNDVEFKRRFRFRKDVIQDILLPMVVDRPRSTNRGLPVPSIIGLLLTLRFYATGNFQIVCGDLRGFNQATVCRTINRVTRRIASQSRIYIKFPENLQEVQMRFHRISNFPNVTGCIDCTHVPIKNPGGPQGELFRNRKRTFSINVQVVAGPALEIFDIVARCPGSYHDSHIFNRSSAKEKFQRREIPGYMLGDAGYPCLPYLLTPFREPRSPGEIRYNQAHIQTRNVVERTFGVLKRRFSCLTHGLANKVETSCYIIVACSVLHNIALSQNDYIEEAEQVDNNIENVVQFPAANIGLGNLMRQNIVHNYFD